MSMRLIIRIQDQFATLSPNEKRLASYIMTHEREIIGLSATELSRAAGVSKSATTRFFRVLGYESFDTVRQQAREELNRAPPGLSVVTTRQLPSHSPEVYLLREVANLTRTLEGVSSDNLRAVATLFAEAPTLWIAGVGEDDTLARLAMQLLSPTRPNVRMVCDSVASIEDHIASFRAKDALLLFNIAARVPIFDMIAEQADIEGLDIVQISDLLQPSLSRARVNLRCQTGFDNGLRCITGVVSLLGLVSERVVATLGVRAERRRALIVSLRED
jgi:DNA-binding MurR/RpiR family transcriptional regulator